MRLRQEDNEKEKNRDIEIVCTRALEREGERERVREERGSKTDRNTSETKYFTLGLA